MNISDIMDYVTSDEYVSQTGDDYFYNLHAEIITENFDGDWSWDDAIQYWDPNDVDQAREIYEEAAE